MSKIQLLENFTCPEHCGVLAKPRIRGQHSDQLLTCPTLYSIRGENHPGGGVWWGACGDDCFEDPQEVPDGHNNPGQAP